ncbi:hypothetical protein HK105_205172 [Polyrhizophydium stewartii]|uniref:Uncharacterized protein n=1 Tax=Polyrhizophydium stewartii TaxID=2732419 RepID=A0ABR4N6Y3_9FUNG
MRFLSRATRAAGTAFAAAALLATSASSRWLQTVTVQLCRNQSNFVPADQLSTDDIVPATLLGEEPACVPDPDAKESRYFVVQSGNTMATQYTCPTLDCKAGNCTALVLNDISLQSQPECGNYYQLITTDNTLRISDIKSQIVRNQGGGAISSAIIVALASKRSPTACSTHVNSASIYYIFEECTPATPQAWIITVFDENSSNGTTRICPTNSCTGKCEDVVFPHKPAQPGKTLCYPDINFDYLYADAIPIKTSSDFASQNPKNAWPKTSRTENPPPSPTSSAPTTTETGFSLVALIGISTGGIALLAVIIGGLVLALKSRSEGSGRRKHLGTGVSTPTAADSALSLMLETSSHTGMASLPSSVYVPSISPSFALGPRHNNPYASQPWPPLIYQGHLSSNVTSSHYHSPPGSASLLDRQTSTGLLSLSSGAQSAVSTTTALQQLAYTTMASDIPAHMQTDPLVELPSLPPSSAASGPGL